MQAQSALDSTISIQFEEVKLKHCLKELSERNFKFSYNADILRIDGKYSGVFQDMPLEEILATLFLDKNIYFQEIGGVIALFKRKNDQEYNKISGFVRESATGEELVGAKVYFPVLNVGVNTNEYGFYSIVAPVGEQILNVSFPGMKTISDTVAVEGLVVIDFELDFAGNVLAPYTKIEEEKIDADESNVNSRDEIDYMTRVVNVGGEPDLMKFMQNSPAVQPANDGGSSYIVRSGGEGNNLVLIDGAPVYHPTHGLGMFSVLNTDAVKSARLYSESIPTKYGERNSSILDVQLKEGNMKEINGIASLGIISSRFSMDGPLVKNKSSFFFSARRSMPDLILKNLSTNLDITNRSFADYSGKVNFHVNKNNRLFFSHYSGEDVYDAFTRFKWGNTINVLRWNHIFSERSFSNLSISSSRFNTTMDIYGFDNERDFLQDIKSYRAQYEVISRLKNNGLLTFGGMISYRDNSYGYQQYILHPDSTAQESRKASENALFASYTKDVTNRLSLVAGARVPVHARLGTGDTSFILNSSSFYFDTLISVAGDIEDLLIDIEPRITLKYSVTESQDLSFSYDRLNQYVHVISNEAGAEMGTAIDNNGTWYANAGGPPVELWYTANRYLPHEQSNQYALKWEGRGKNIGASALAYYRSMSNVLDEISYSGVNFHHFESNLAPTTVTTSGIEIVGHVRKGPFNSVLSYTYSNSWQKGKLINNGVKYRPFGHRPHFLTLEGTYEFGDDWMVSAKFFLHSGGSVHLPNGQVVIDGIAVGLFESRNSERLPTYHRLDLGLSKKFEVNQGKINGLMKVCLNNAYNRYNPTYVRAGLDSEDTSVLKFYSITYLPILPTVTLRCLF